MPVLDSNINILPMHPLRMYFNFFLFNFLYIYNFIIIVYYNAVPFVYISDYPVCELQHAQ